MRVSLGMALCWLLLAVSAMAQRRGMVGGFRGGFGGFGQARVFSGGGFRGGFGGFGGIRTGFNQPFVGNRFLFGNRFFLGNRFFFNNRFFFANRFLFNHGFFGFRNSFVFPAFGFGISYSPGFYDYPNDYPAGPLSATAPNTTVIYPVPAQTAAPTANVKPQSDQFTNQPSVGGSPIYLIAFKDHMIRAAAAYWVDGRTLHYITPQREENEAAVDTVDRELTLQLNRERHVPIQLPEP